MFYVKLYVQSLVNEVKCFKVADFPSLQLLDSIAQTFLEFSFYRRANGQWTLLGIRQNLENILSVFL